MIPHFSFTFIYELITPFSSYSLPPRKFDTCSSGGRPGIGRWDGETCQAQVFLQYHGMWFLLNVLCKYLSTVVNAWYLWYTLQRILQHFFQPLKVHFLFELSLETLHPFLSLWQCYHHSSTHAYVFFTYPFNLLRRNMIQKSQEHISYFRDFRTFIKTVLARCQECPVRIIHKVTPAQTGGWRSTASGRSK